MFSQLRGSRAARQRGAIGIIALLVQASVDVISKRLSQLHDLAPKAELIGLLLDPNDMEVGVQLREAEAAAATIGRSLLAGC